jgi:hypothetical protein
MEDQTMPMVTAGMVGRLNINVSCVIWLQAQFGCEQVEVWWMLQVRLRSGCCGAVLAMGEKNSSSNARISRDEREANAARRQLVIA